MKKIEYKVKGLSSSGTLMVQITAQTNIGRSFGDVCSYKECEETIKDTFSVKVDSLNIILRSGWRPANEFYSEGIFWVRGYDDSENDRTMNMSVYEFNLFAAAVMAYNLKFADLPAHEYKPAGTESGAGISWKVFVDDKFYDSFDDRVYNREWITNMCKAKLGNPDVRAVVAIPVFNKLDVILTKKTKVKKMVETEVEEITVIQ